LGDEVPKLKRLTRQLKLDDCIIFTGYIPEKQALEILSTADVCLSPDPSNPLNDVSTMNKMMEYMALGKPIVSFDLKEARLSAGESALYVENYNIRAFAEGILQLLHDPHLSQKMGEIGKERIEGKLCWQKQESSLINAYKYVLTKKSN
jgi:glycosyltransferase involved in cell wall biosynthesis